MSSALFNNYNRECCFAFLCLLVLFIALLFTAQAFVFYYFDVFKPMCFANCFISSFFPVCTLFFSIYPINSNIFITNSPNDISNSSLPIYSRTMSIFLVTIYSSDVNMFWITNYSCLVSVIFFKYLFLYELSVLRILFLVLLCRHWGEWYFAYFLFFSFIVSDFFNGCIKSFIFDSY